MIKYELSKSASLCSLQLKQDLGGYLNDSLSKTFTHNQKREKILKNQDGRLQMSCNDGQSTLALQTPRYCEHPADADKSQPSGETHKEMTEKKSHYY